MTQNLIWGEGGGRRGRGLVALMLFCNFSIVVVSFIGAVTEHPQLPPAVEENTDLPQVSDKSFHTMLYV